MSGRSRGILALLLLGALVLSGAMRVAAGRYKQSAHLVRPITSAQRLNSLNSYSLGLFLGGLRGPLVMYLWPSAENQKANKDLEDIDTKIELIRMLQAEYDSVHIFQIWNKAYNLSVQMAAKPNKYAMILSGLDYAKDVDRERPDNLNILTQIASLYFDKLGNSAEKAYYIERIRGETLPAMRLSFPTQRIEEFLSAAQNAGLSIRPEEIGSDPKTSEAVVLLRLYDADLIKPFFSGDGVKYEVRSRQAMRASGEGSRRMFHDQVLDEHGHILPELLRGDGRRQPAQLAEGGLWNNGAELQYLEPYDKAGGFPYGLPPQALAYNYYMRSAVLRQTTGQKHLQLSDRVIDERPAVALRGWSEQEWEHARGIELRLFGLKPENDRILMEVPSADKGPKDIVHPADLPQAIFGYQRAVRLMDDALAQFQELLKTDIPVWDKYAATRATLVATAALVRADAAYLRAIANPSAPAAPSLLAQARSDYQSAIDQSYRVLLKYYVDDELADHVYRKVSDGSGRVYSRANVEKLDPSYYPQLNDAVRAAIQAPAKLGGRDGLDNHSDDRVEFESYIHRATQRLAMIDKLGRASSGPSTRPF